MKNLIDKRLLSLLILLEKGQYQVLMDYFGPIIFAYESEPIDETISLISKYFPNEFDDFQRMTLYVTQPQYAHLSDKLSRLISLSLFLFRAQFVVIDPNTVDILDSRLQLNAYAFFQVEIEDLLADIRAQTQATKSR